MSYFSKVYQAISSPLVKKVTSTCLQAIEEVKNVVLRYTHPQTTASENIVQAEITIEHTVVEPSYNSEDEDSYSDESTSADDENGDYSIHNHILLSEQKEVDDYNKLNNDESVNIEDLEEIALDNSNKLEEPHYIEKEIVAEELKEDNVTDSLESGWGEISDTSSISVQDIEDDFIPIEHSTNENTPNLENKPSKLVLPWILNNSLVQTLLSKMLANKAIDMVADKFMRPLAHKLTQCAMEKKIEMACAGKSSWVATMIKARFKLEYYTTYQAMFESNLAYYNTMTKSTLYMAHTIYNVYSKEGSLSRNITEEALKQCLATYIEANYSFIISGGFIAINSTGHFIGTGNVNSTLGATIGLVTNLVDAASDAAQTQNISSERYVAECMAEIMVNVIFNVYDKAADAMKNNPVTKSEDIILEDIAQELANNWTKVNFEPGQKSGIASNIASTVVRQVSSVTQCITNPLKSVASTFVK